MYADAPHESNRGAPAARRPRGETTDTQDNANDSN